jgi:hypothetical protein
LNDAGKEAGKSKSARRNLLLNLTNIIISRRPCFSFYRLFYLTLSEIPGLSTTKVQAVFSIPALLGGLQGNKLSHTLSAHSTGRYNWFNFKRDE